MPNGDKQTFVLEIRLRRAATKSGRTQKWGTATMAQVLHSGVSRMIRSHTTRKVSGRTLIDADELIVPRRGDVRDLIEANADAPAVVPNWAMYGSPGHKTRPPGLMIETFLRRANPTFGVAGSSSLSSGRRLCAVCTGRMPFLLTGPARTAAGRTPRQLVLDAMVGIEHAVAQINHYFTKSLQGWQERQARGYRCGHGGWRAEPFAKYDHNVIEDRSALRSLPQVSGILDRTLHAGHGRHCDPDRNHVVSMYLPASS